MNYLKVIILSFTLIMSGCAGFGVLYPSDTTPISNPKISSSFGKIYTTRNEKQYTCSEVIELWGEPDSLDTEGEIKTLTYKYGLVFAGIMPIVIIPIPLALPVGQKKTIIECHNNIVVRAYKTATGMSAAYCGMISERPDYGCQTE